MVAWAVIGVIVFDFGPDFSIEAVPWLPTGADLFELIFAAGAFGLAIARYRSTRFRVTETTIEFRRGVLFRTERTTRRDRIQNVAIGAGLLGRIFGVNTVQVSAGDSAEIELTYVGAQTAQRLRDGLLPDPATPPTLPGVAGSGAATTEAIPIRTIAQLDSSGFVRYLITGPVVVSGLFAVVLIGLAIGLREFWPLLNLAAILFFFLGAGDVFDFRADISGDRLQVSQGLIRREEKSAELDRIQVIQVVRPFIRGLFGFETVRLQTADVSGETSMQVNMLSPLEPAGRGLALVADIFGSIGVTEQDLVPPARVAIRRGFIRAFISLVVVGIVLAVSTAIIVVVNGLDVSAATAIVAVSLYLGASVVVSFLYTTRRYHRLGHAVGERHVMVSTGVFRRRLAVVPIAKIQSVGMRRSFWQRRAGISSITIDTAGMSLAGITATTVIDIPAGLGRDLARRLGDGASRVALPDGV